MRLKPKEKGDQYYTLKSFHSFNSKTLPKKGFIATFYYNYGLSRQSRRILEALPLLLDLLILLIEQGK